MTTSKSDAKRKLNVRPVMRVDFAEALFYTFGGATATETLPS